MKEGTASAVLRAAGCVVRVYVARAIECLRTPKVYSRSQIPLGADAITCQWLTQVLCAGHPGVSVVAMHSSNASSQTTSRVALELEYSAGAPAHLPRHVFIKFTETAQQRLLSGLIRIIDGEPAFYGRFRHLAEFECPHGYYAQVNPRTWASAVVMEDIGKTRAARFCHATTQVDRKTMMSLLETMASYHGQFWEHPAVLESQLKRPLDHLHNIGVFLNARKQSRAGVARTPDLPAPLLAEHDRLWRCLELSMHELSHLTPVTLLHGDPHVGNTYINGDGQMALSDWQVVMRGGWAYDVAGAIASALTIADRRAWERELLAFYLQRLAEYGGQPPSFAQAFDLYRRSLMYPFFCWTTVLGAPAWMPDTQPADVAITINQRIGAAIIDLDAMGAFDDVAVQHAENKGALNADT